MSTPSPHTPAPLTDPGQLISNLPGVLGFYPSDSILVMILSPQDSRDYQLGPTLRVDADDADHLAQSLSGMVERTDVVLILIVSTHQETVERALSQITTLVGHLIEGIWHCHHIEEGEPLRLLYGPTVPDVPEWRETVIPALHQAAATRDLTARGGHLALDRHEAHRAYQPMPLTREMNQALDAAVDAVSERLEAATSTQEGDVQRLIAELRQGLEAMPAGATYLDVAPDLVAFMCSLLSTDDLDIRDLVLGEVVDCPEAGAVVAHAVGVYTPHVPTRVTGLVAHALAVMAHIGPTQSASAALRVAHEAAPAHGLTALIHGAVSHGVAPTHIVQCVMGGVRILRQRYGLSP